MPKLLIIAPVEMEGRTYGPGEIAGCTLGEAEYLFVRGAARPATQAELAAEAKQSAIPTGVEAAVVGSTGDHAVVTRIRKPRERAVA